MKAIAKITSYMEDFKDDIWIRKGDIYILKQNNSMDDKELYEFIDAKGYEHYIEVEDFDKYFIKFKYCETCEWLYKEHCCNGLSDMCTEAVSEDDHCEKWDEKVTTNCEEVAE